MLEEFLLQLISLRLTSFQLYGLIFLLGALTVAAWSDLKHLAVQHEFLEVWLGIFFVLVIFDVLSYGALNVLLCFSSYLFIKYTLIILFVIICSLNRPFNILFKISRADIVACIAIMALLSPFIIILFIIFMLVFDRIFRYVFCTLSRMYVYPFIPVITLSTILILLVARYISIIFG